MEHDPSPPERPSDPWGSDPEKEPSGCVSIIAKVVIGLVILFVVVVAFVFGVCFL